MCMPESTSAPVPPILTFSPTQAGRACRPHERTAEERAKLSNQLRSVPGLLNHMAPELLSALCSRAAFEEHAAGSPVYMQDDIGHTMYIVLEGQCDIYRRFERSPRPPSDSIAGAPRLLCTFRMST